MINEIINASCYDALPEIADRSIDMLFCDLPYATAGRSCTSNDWDVPMDLPALWAQFNRVCKPKAAMVFTANIPLACALYTSNKKQFRYEWIWCKNYSTGFANANKRPLVQHELVLVFSKKPTMYNPVKTRCNIIGGFSKKGTPSENYGDLEKVDSIDLTGDRFPTSLLYANRDQEICINHEIPNRIKNHPTQKPIALLEYLIKTYTNEQATILDPTAGACTTAVACIQTNRNFICIEQLEKYCDIGRERIKRASSKVASQLFTPSQIHSQTSQLFTPSQIHSQTSLF